MKGERKVTLPVELAGLCEIADLQGNVRKADLSSRELVLMENPVYLNRAPESVAAVRPCRLIPVHRQAHGILFTARCLTG